MRLVGSDRMLNEITVNDGPVVKRNKDGTFHVPDQLGKSMVRSGEWGVAGLNFQHIKGFICNDCGRVNVFRDHCGKCDGTNLRPE